MAVFLISISAETLGFDYEALNLLVGQLKAKRVMPWVWLCDTGLGSRQLAAAVEHVLGLQDRFFIADVGPRWVSGRIEPETARWLLDRRP